MSVLRSSWMLLLDMLQPRNRCTDMNSTVVSWQNAILAGNYCSNILTEYNIFLLNILLKPKTDKESLSHH